VGRRTPSGVYCAQSWEAADTGVLRLFFTATLMEAWAEPKVEVALM
jgi:hypothetical protein